MIEATVIADSINTNGDRLTTVEVNVHRFVLAELNTHRAFSRNSASSRAIPVEKQIERVLNDPAIPIEFGSNQSGMQAGPPLEGLALLDAEREWLIARNQAVVCARMLLELGVHKQVTNRLLEPFMWHRVIISATEWDNFFAQRCSPLAQPEIRVAAEAIASAIGASTPTVRFFQDDPHLPYVTEADAELSVGDRIRVAVARCARVSYLTHDGVRDPAQDIDLFNKLVTANPPHWSPLEHVALPSPATKTSRVSTTHRWSDMTGNFDGWAQMRHLIPNGFDIDVLGD
jgi:thymidylate synthase ThyX